MALLYISIIILVVDIYICVVYHLTKEKIYTEDDEYLMAIASFDYALFLFVLCSHVIICYYSCYALIACGCLDTSGY